MCIIEWLVWKLYLNRSYVFHCSLKDLSFDMHIDEIYFTFDNFFIFDKKVLRVLEMLMEKIPRMPTWDRLNWH